MKDVIDASVAFAIAKLQHLLGKLGVRIITTNFAHGTQIATVIDGTQKKGYVTARDPAVIAKALDAILDAVLQDVAKCEGANGYLLNFLNVEFCQPALARVVLRGCPTITPDGFDFARASSELTDPIVGKTGYPYGYDLACHPSFVSQVDV